MVPDQVAWTDQTITLEGAALPERSAAKSVNQLAAIDQDDDADARCHILHRSFHSRYDFHGLDYSLQRCGPRDPLYRRSRPVWHERCIA
jgi:hypothetical protein